MAQNKLVEWVMDNVTEWKDHRDSNYLSDWKEYERLWRGQWAAEDKLRSSERSRITSPALQQAIENHTSEIEEAVFGQGDYLFDIEDDMLDENQDSSDIEHLKAYMKESFKLSKVRKAVGDIVLLGSVYGTGIGEIITKKVKSLRPATQEMPEANATAIGVESYDQVIVTLKPINPQNFIIDPSASTIDEAMGVAIEEFVSSHVVAQNIKDGIYKDDEDLAEDTTSDSDIEPTWLEEAADEGRVKIVRYYGLVPLGLLESEGEGEVEEIFKDGVSPLIKTYGDLVEAIIVIANGKVLLKAEKSPYMMQDRPIVAYQDDSIPNKFYGRGIAEKGYNMQKAIDAQLRSHMDSLALTTVPMVAMDATRMPRGSKFEVIPGKTVLTNGNPNEIMMPFTFGQTGIGNVEAANNFERMLLQATGTLDNASLGQGQAEGGSMSIALSGLIRKNKRTLVNFQDQFLIPFIQKAAYRFMQFDPEHFKTKDWKFVPASTLGMLAKEVEQNHVFNLLKTLGPDSPLTPILMLGVVQNSNLPNKAGLVKMIEQSMQPKPEQEQQQQLQMQIAVETAKAQIGKLQSEAQVNQSEAALNMVDVQMKPEELKLKAMIAASTNLPNDDDKIAAEFDRRIKIADLMLKEADMKQNMEIVKEQMKSKNPLSSSDGN